MKSESELVEELKAQIGFGVTQTALAKKLGMSRAYLNEILHGHKNLGDEIAAKMGYRKVFVENGKGKKWR